MSARRRESTSRDYYDRMLRVLDHIHRHLDEELTLEVLARVAAFSPYHFHYVFRGIVGEGLGEYLRRLRLERAWHRLLDGGADRSRSSRETRATFGPRFTCPSMRKAETRSYEPWMPSPCT